MSGAVYVIAARAEGPCKVGRAVSVDARLKTLQTGNPERLRAFATCQPTNGAARIEVDAHWALRSRRLVGEWFDVSVREAGEAVRCASRALGGPEVVWL